MSALSIRRVAVLACRATRSARVQVRANTSVPFNRDKTSNTPLVEHYRSAWPDGNPDKPADSIVLPERTISDDVLNFGMRMSMEQGQSFFYPHLETNPADLKVRMMVFLKDLNLNREELQIFVRMCGQRINVGNASLKLVCEKFPNKLENRKYCILLLEQLLAESRRLAKMEDKFVDTRKPKKAVDPTDASPALGDNHQAEERVESVEK